MRDSLFVRTIGAVDEIGPWAQDCALRAGWSAPEAEQLGDCAARSARRTFETVYCRKQPAGMLVGLDVDDSGVCVELIHEGSEDVVEADAFLTDVSVEPAAGRQAHVLRLSHRR